MSYKFLEISTFYEKYLEYFYNKNPDISYLDYNEHLKLLLSDCFAECDFIHPELHNLGVESDIIIYNDEKLQRKWKEEYTNSSLFEIVCAQIKAYKPDVIYFNDINLFTEKQLNFIRVICKEKCKFVAWHFTVVNNSFSRQFNCFDQIYTGSKYILSLIKPYCKNVQLLYHAFSSSVLKKISTPIKVNELVFPGSIFLGEDIHNNRIDMFGKLYQKGIPINFYGNLYGSIKPSNLKQTIKCLIQGNYPTRERLQSEEILRKKIKKSVFGLDFYNTINNFTICINQHAPIAGTGAGNMRMFEATGVGTCLLTDYREENSDLFKIDEEIVVYKNYDELLEKAEYLINHPNVVSEIAKCGQKRTLDTHSYKIKANMMNEYIQKIL